MSFRFKNEGKIEALRQAGFTLVRSAWNRHYDCPCCGPHHFGWELIRPKGINDSQLKKQVRSVLKAAGY